MSALTTLLNHMEPIRAQFCHSEGTLMFVMDESLLESMAKEANDMHHLVPVDEKILLDSIAGIPVRTHEMQPTTSVFIYLADVLVGVLRTGSGVYHDLHHVLEPARGYPKTVQ